MSLIIGSSALKYYYNDFPRQPKDLDIVIKSGVNSRKDNTEYLVNPIILKYQNEGYLKPELLLSLKISHLFWDLNWEKHLFDVQFLLDKGVKYNTSLVLELRSMWENILPKTRRSVLEMDKNDFFNNAVNDTVEQHDVLHTLLNPIPMYTKLLKDGCEVELDENKWNRLTFNEKCDVVFEETAVMSFERYKQTHYKVAYLKQLKDNIIKHFPFYIALFAIENYKELQKPKYNYKIKIENGLQIN